MGGNNLGMDDLSRVLDLMSRTARTCQVYPPGHRLRNTFLLQLYEELESYLKTAGRMECRIEELDVCDDKGRPVFQGRKEDLFPWALYKNGIRGLIIYRGLTFEELKGFIDLMVKETDDLLYFLLEADMPHISYEVAEYVVLDEEIDTSQEGEETSQEELLDLDGSFSNPQFVEVEDFALTEEDLTYINKELKEAENRDYLSSYLDIILEIFPMEEYSDLAEDIIKSVGLLAVESLGWNDIYLCLTLVKNLKKLLEREDLDSARRKQVEEVLGMLRTSKTLDLIKKNYSPSWGNSLQELLLLLDPSDMGGILKWMEEEEREGAKNSLLAFLRVKLENSPSLMLSCYQRSGPKVKREIVRIAEDLRVEESKKVLEMALESPLEEVKKEALKVSLKLDPGSLEKLTDGYLASESSSIRTLLFDAVVEVGGVPSLARLLAEEVDKEDFVSRSYLEKRLFFYSLSLSDADLFEEALKKLASFSPGWRQKKKWEETLGVALNVALDSGSMALDGLGSLVRKHGSRKALKIWEKVCKKREETR